MDINNISEVNAKYIFFINEDGKQDRKTAHYSELQEILDDLQTDYYFYMRMLRETETTYNRINVDYETTEKRIADLEKRIAERKEEPAVKRGLADICFDYENAKKDSGKIAMQLSGIRQVSHDTRNKLERAERLIKQVESAMRRCVA